MVKIQSEKNTAKKKLLRIVQYVLLALSIVLLYKDLPRTFFQQDEWWNFGTLIASDTRGGFIKVFLDFLLIGAKVHSIPFATAIFYILFKLFFLNFWGYALFSIFLHIVNSLLVFYLMSRLTKNRLISFFAAMLFALNAIPHQAVTWFSASIVVLGESFFSLLAILFFIIYIEKRKQKYLYLSLIFIISSLFFYESALFLYVFLPLISFFVYRISLKEFIKKIVPSGALSFLSYMLIRFPLWLFAPPIVLGLTQVLNQPSPAVYLFRFFVIPFRFISQSLFLHSQILYLSNKMTFLAYPQFILSDNTVNPYISETIGFDLISFLISILIIIAAYLSYSYFKSIGHREHAKTLLFAFLLVISYGLPNILLPGNGGYATLIERRYLYLPVMAMSIIFVLILYAILTYFISRKKISKALFSVIIILVLIFHIQNFLKDMSTLLNLSNLRKSFLVEVKSKYPTLPKPTVFYLKSNLAYYGLPANEQNLPVQSGFGRMLIIWYQDVENFPPCLYDNLFLHDLIAEGYRNCEGRGFGYFRDYDKLINAIKENKIPSENIIAFSWDGKREEFKDITKLTREQIKKELEK